MHEKTHSAGARLLVRLTSLAMARFGWQEWLDSDEFDISSAGFFAVEQQFWWLEELRPLLSPYDVTLLERYIPVLPPESLQKVKTEFQSDHAAYLARNRQRTQQRPAEKIISKMSMRRILGTTFARLGLTDFLFQEMHKQWQATTTRSNRTGQQRAMHHTQQWHQRRGHHGRG